jgi:hypothetical protein
VRRLWRDYGLSITLVAMFEAKVDALEAKAAKA